MKIYYAGDWIGAGNLIRAYTEHLSLPHQGQTWFLMEQIMRATLNTWLINIPEQLPGEFIAHNDLLAPPHASKVKDVAQAATIHTAIAIAEGYTIIENLYLTVPEQRIEKRTWRDRLLSGTPWITTRTVVTPEPDPHLYIYEPGQMIIGHPETIAKLRNAITQPALPIVDRDPDYEYE